MGEWLECKRLKVQVPPSLAASSIICSQLGPESHFSIANWFTPSQLEFLLVKLFVSVYVTGHKQLE